VGVSSLLRISSFNIVSTFALETFLIVWVGLVVAIKDSHFLYNNAWVNSTSLNSTIYRKVLDTSVD